MRIKEPSLECVTCGRKHGETVLVALLTRPVWGEPDPDWAWLDARPEPDVRRLAARERLLDDQGCWRSSLGVLLRPVSAALPRSRETVRLWRFQDGGEVFCVCDRDLRGFDDLREFYRVEPLPLAENVSAEQMTLSGLA